MLQDAAKSYEAHPWFQGKTLVGIALTIFILPLALAIVGGHLACHWWGDGESDTLWQVIGLAGGLIVGLALARVIVWASRVTRHVKSNDGGHECSQR